MHTTAPDWPLCEHCKVLPAAMAPRQCQETGETHVYRFCSVACRLAARDALFEVRRLAEAVAIEPAQR